MTLKHGTYLFAARQIGDKCPVVVGDWPCCLPANHAPLECQYFTEAESRRLGVVPAPNSISMHDPIADERLPVVPRMELPDEDAPQVPAPTQAQPFPMNVGIAPFETPPDWERDKNAPFVYENGIRFEPPPG